MTVLQKITKEPIDTSTNVDFFNSKSMFLTKFLRTILGNHLNVMTNKI